jgi:mannitol-1-phosphate 5-dehydrogenase
MSGVITDPAEVARLDLAPLTPATPGRAVLVESFNRILISRITLPGAACGIPAFVQTDHLPAFGEAKLYGHNAVHALLGCLARQRGLTVMAQAREHDDLMALARRAFLKECGPALCRKHAASGEPLFTEDGFRAYADDLLQRMVNPNLHDLVARVIRDPRRKLGYDDRIFGAMRLALTQDVAPLCMAQGAAIAVQMLAQSEGLAVDSPASVARLLEGLWGPTQDGLAPRLMALTWDALSRTT